MIDIRRLRQDPEAVRSALRRRLDPSLDATLTELTELDRRRREALVQAETLKASRNAASEEVARRKKAGQPADDLLAELKKSSELSKQLEAEAKALDEQQTELLLGIPNIPHQAVPDGDATANRVVRTWGEKPAFDFTPRPHWELGEMLGLFDLARGTRAWTPPRARMKHWAAAALGRRGEGREIAVRVVAPRESQRRSSFTCALSACCCRCWFSRKSVFRRRNSEYPPATENVPSGYARDNSTMRVAPCSRNARSCVTTIDAN